MTGSNGRIVDMEISGGSVIEAPAYQVYGSKGGLTLNDDTIYLKYLEPETETIQRIANEGTPEVGFVGSKDNLNWLEKSIPVTKGDPSVIWHELYKAIRLGGSYPINIDEAVEVMNVVSKAKEGTNF
jgi:hypothetical protein